MPLLLATTLANNSHHQHLSSTAAATAATATMLLTSPTAATHCLATATSAAGVNVQITGQGVSATLVDDQLQLQLPAMAASAANYAANVAHLNGFNPKDNCPPVPPTKEAFEGLLRLPQIQVKQEFMESPPERSSCNPMNHQQLAATPGEWFASFSWEWDYVVSLICYGWQGAEQLITLHYIILESV